jgi:Arc/MetJ-type ribon-helix-helix transcriptional regulator
VKLITLHLPESYLRDLDELVSENYYPNRAEAIRVAVRDLISDELWERRRAGGRSV